MLPSVGGDPSTIERGNEIEEALIEAAANALADVGPRAMSLRSVADAAGVNHGQVHHYFGGKQGLVTAAMRRLAVEHLNATLARWGDANLPPPGRLREDDRYVRAVTRTVLDGDMETALLEIREGISVPRRVLAATAARQDRDEATSEAKAALIASFAIEFAWAGLEPFLLQLADVREDEVEKVADLVMSISRSSGRHLGIA